MKTSPHERYCPFLSFDGPSVPVLNCASLDRLMSEHAPSSQASPYRMDIDTVPSPPNHIESLNDVKGDVLADRAGDLSSEGKVELAGRVLTGCD